MFSEGDNQEPQHITGNPTDGLVTQTIDEARGLAKGLDEVFNSGGLGTPGISREMIARLQFSLYSLATMLEIAVGREPTILEYTPYKGNVKQDRFKP